jgi:hypothetical protein
MSEFYCHNCAKNQGWMNSAYLTDITGTPYQDDKLKKYTQQPTGYPIHPISIYNDPSPNNISGLMWSAFAFGCCEIDDQGRENLVWDAGKQVGTTRQSGVPDRMDNSVKIVLPNDPQKQHAFPTASTLIQSGYCLICGQPLTA